MAGNPKVLLVGIDPTVIDYTSGPLAGFSAAGVMEVIAADQARFAEHRIDTDLCLIGLSLGSEAVVEPFLARSRYDCVVIGGGLRKPDQAVALFERVLNLVHQQAAGTPIAFNTRIGDSLEAAQRWLPEG